MDQSRLVLALTGTQKKTKRIRLKGDHLAQALLFLVLTGSDGKVDLLILIFVLAGSRVSRFAIGGRLHGLRGIAILDFIYLLWRR